MVQVDVYRRDRRLDRSFAVEGTRLYASLCRLAGRPLESLMTLVLGQVSVMRVDLGARGYAVLEHVA